MNKSESITHLATALAKAQAEMPVAVMDATNPFLKNKYATLGSVITASRPVLAKHKLSLVQFPISEIRDLTRDTPHPASGQPNLGLAVLPRAEKGIVAERGTNGGHGVPRPTTEYIGVESILTHESGEFIADRILISLTEEKGKSRVQAAGSVLTYLRRYSWAAILGMYADEDADGTGNLPVGNVAAPPGPKTSPPTSSALPPVPVKQHLRN